MAGLRFDVYGQFFVDVVREAGRWEIYRVGSEGKRMGAGVRIPADTPVEAIADLLDAHFHELARPGTVVRRVEGLRKREDEAG